MKEYLAFDVGGTSVKYALCNEEGEVSSASKFKTPDTLDQMYLEMEKVVHNYPNVEGIALSMPGAVDSDGGIIYGSSAINYIHGPNIKEDLQNRFHKPVELENDANCAALAEVWKGVAKEESDCCFIVSGTGIGGAVIKDKHVHHGNALHGGEFGYTTKEDYLEGANEVVTSASSKHKQEAEDGDDIYYDAENNEIVFVSKDGYIRTYFKPSDGIEYYNRQ